jgi:hypothetical protein
MNLCRRLYALCVTLFTLVAVAVSPAYAQGAAVPAPRIDQFYVEPANQLTPGTELTFTVAGTPRGTAAVRVTGISRSIPLQEIESGVYEGSYTITTRDQISAGSTMRATLRVRGKLATQTQPLGAVASAPSAAVGATGAAASALSLTNFTMSPVSRVEPGSELTFTLSGSPGARASFTIENIVQNVPMREVRPGQYEGSYTIRRSDRLPATLNVVGALEANGQVNRMRLSQPLSQNAGIPAIKNVSPRDRETVRENPVVVSGTFDDAGAAGIDPTTVKLVVSGNDVTQNTTITPQSFTYRADLRPGNHQVVVTARDRNGNNVRHAWSFNVATGAAAGGAPAAATATIPVQILSHENNAQVPSGPVEIRGRTVADAEIHATVQATASLAGALGLSQQIFNQRLRSDVNGNFSFVFQSPVRIPDTRFEVTIVVTKDGQSKETRLVLQQR